MFNSYGSEGFALAGYVVIGFVEDGDWMLSGDSSVVVAAFAVARFFFRPVLGKVGVCCY